MTGRAAQLLADMLLSTEGRMPNDTQKLGRVILVHLAHLATGTGIALVQALNAMVMDRGFDGSLPGLFIALVLLTGAGAWTPCVALFVSISLCVSIAITSAVILLLAGMVFQALGRIDHTQ